MTYFGGFLKQVRLHAQTRHPVTWDIRPTNGSIVASYREQHRTDPEEQVKKLTNDTNKLLYITDTLPEYTLDPHVGWYIGSLLLNCAAFCDDHGITGEPKDRCTALLQQLDEQEKVSDTMVYELLQCLKLIHADIILFSQSELYDSVSGQA